MRKPQHMKDFMQQAVAADAPVPNPIGQYVKNMSGKAGVVRGTSSGYLLVSFTGSDKLWGYLPGELEILDVEPTLP